MSDAARGFIAIIIGAVIIIALLFVINEGQRDCEARGGNYKYNHLVRMYKCEVP